MQHQLKWSSSCME